MISAVDLSCRRTTTKGNRPASAAGTLLFVRPCPPPFEYNKPRNMLIHAASRAKLDTDAKLPELSSVNLPPAEKDREKIQKITLKKQPMLKRIAANFFESLKGVTLVEIDGTGLKSLPSSIGLLTNLEELLLPANHLRSVLSLIFIIEPKY